MEFKGTKGEWKVSRLSTNLMIRKQNPNSDLDCNCVDVNGHQGGISVFAGETLKERKANAQLIATAPELLKALQDLYSAIDSCIDLTPELMKSTKKVINKALGND